MRREVIHYTNTTPIMIWCSYKIKIRTDRKKQTTAPLVLQMFIGGEKLVLSLGLQVDIKEWDPVNTRLRGKGEEAQRVRIAIDDVRTAITNIQLEHRRVNRALTKNSFLEAFLNRKSREDFLTFFSERMEARYNAGEITEGTYRHHRAVLTKLQNFYTKVPFDSLTHSFLEELRRKFIAHYKKVSENDSHANSIHSQFKAIRTYVNIALNSGINFEYPFTTFKSRPGHSRIIFLNKEELAVMLKAWQIEKFRATEHYALQVFLFACYTSLRISDIKRLTEHDIADDHLVIREHKNRRVNKFLRIPLNQVSKMLLEGRKGIIFQNLTEQKININLKRISAMLGISKNVTLHVGRHTFATEFLRRGGQPHVLQKIMGHKDIKTTMVYVHLEDQHVTRQMQLMNEG